jgi:uncharacterized membrane protein
MNRHAQPAAYEGSSQNGHMDPRGLWQVALGAILAVLAPLAGFLGGTLAVRSGAAVDVEPLLAWLTGGLGLGGVGLVITGLGAVRWHRANRGRRAGGIR